MAYSPAASKSGPGVLAIAWNQDQGCFTLGTENGYAIWNSEPVEELCRRDVGGVQHVAMYLRSSVLALVGGGRNPFDASNKVVIWNDAEQTAIAHMEFRLPVLSVQRQKNVLVVVTLTKFYMYSFKDNGDGVVSAPTLLDSIDTVDNPLGLLSTSFNALSQKTLLAFPANTVGHACIVEAPATGDGASTKSKSKPPMTVKAHKTGLAHLVLSRSGKLLASSSARGTLLRVFDVESAAHLYSFRRGLTAAQVHSISFNRNETMLCGHFDEMLYCWRIADTRKSPGGLLNLAEQYLPNIDEITTPAFAQIRTIAGHRALCSFEGGKTSILTVCWNGTARKYKYHASGMQTTEFYRLLKPNENELLRLLNADLAATAD